MSKQIIKTNLKGTDKIELKYNGREVDMTLTDFKTYLDGVLEPSNSILVSNEPLKYKALLSQNAPIASTVNVSMVAGQIWTLEIYSGLDMTDPFNQLELISGTIRVAGSKYRSNADVSYIFTNTQMSYDGSPYVVSTDVNGDLNPFINTLGENPVFNKEGSDGAISVDFTFDISKLSFKIFGQGDSVAGNDAFYINTIDKTSVANKYYFTTIKESNNVAMNDLLNYSKIEIEIYP